MDYPRQAARRAGIVRRASDYRWVWSKPWFKKLADAFVSPQIGLLRTELRAPASLWKGHHGRLDGEMCLGVECSMVFSGREIPASLAGGDVAFKVAGRQLVRRFIGASLKYKVPKLNLMLSANVEGGYNTNSTTSVWGQLGFEWAF